MSDLEACPTCGKPVMGETALVAHLEFSHDIDDPHEYLRSLEAPEPGRDWAPILRWGGVGAASLAALVIAVVAIGLLSGDSSADVAASEGATTTTAAVPETTAAPTTTAPPTTTVPPTTAAPTTTTTAPPVTQPAKAPAGGDVDTGDFRKPFLRDARIVACEAGGDADRHEIGFSFTGARDIVFDGVGFPDDTGDGAHTMVHRAAPGSTGYVDHVSVADGDGNEYQVPITPPLYFQAC